LPVEEKMLILIELQKNSPLYPAQKTAK